MTFKYFKEHKFKEPKYQEPKDTDIINFEQLVFHTRLSPNFWKARIGSSWCCPIKNIDKKVGVSVKDLQFVWGDVKKWLDQEMRIKGINK